MRTAGVCLLAGLLLTAAGAGAPAEPTNMLLNPSFEFGRGMPDHWAGFGFGTRNWEFDGREGERCISIAGNGMDSGWWYADRWVQVQPNRMYRLSYWVRRDAAAEGGMVLSGLNLVNRSAPAGEQWESRHFFFRTPEWLPDLQLRLGQKQVDGVTYFDEVALHPAVAMHQSRGPRALSLGAGETIMEGRYAAVHEMSGKGTSDCRFLHHFSGSFDTDRWILNRFDEVVYRHSVERLGATQIEHRIVGHLPTGPQGAAGPGAVLDRTPRDVTVYGAESPGAVQQRDITVEVTVNCCEGGRLSVEASRDGKLWARLSAVGSPGVARIAVPRKLFPATEIWIRLKSEHAERIEVTGYRYTSVLEKAGSYAAAVGASYYLVVLHSPPDLAIELADAGDLIPGGRHEFKALIENRGERRKLRASVVITRGGETVSESEDVFHLGSGHGRRVYLPYTVQTTGQQTLRFLVSDADSGSLLALAEGDFTVPALWEASGGERLHDDPELCIWWCEPERKVSEIRPAPAAEGGALRISAAGNEYESAQLVLTPADWTRQCRLRAGDLESPDGSRIPASAVDIRCVAYVLITQRTDDAGELGRWPDPLPPLQEPVDLRPGRNHPFWITVHVPPGTPAGDYRGEVAIEADTVEASVPIHVHVWGFDLPRQTRVRSGFALSAEEIKRYHNLETDEELRRTLALYLESFAAHRASPLWVGREIGVTWQTTADGGVEPVLDFSGFDEDAQQALDEFGFERLALKVGGFDEIAGFNRGTPQYEAAFARYMALIQDHLESRGWLGRAYVCCFGGPGRKDWQPARYLLELMQRGAPKLTRMFVGAPAAQLEGLVDAWCLPACDPRPEWAEARKRAGEQVWWYLSRESTAPSLGQFLDHHGTEMRLWLWATWKYGMDGILARETNYWDSETAYPRSAVQNPWDDPMSWQSGPELPEGARIARGNGDGRLIYPPNRHAPYEERKFLEGPVASIRWELLRDGIEDYEYFQLLQAEVERLKDSGADAQACQAAEELLEVPPEVLSDLTCFATDPGPIHNHRAKLAEAIERLAGRPGLP